jgi:hypothetical protein
LLSADKANSKINAEAIVLVISHPYNYTYYLYYTLSIDKEKGQQQIKPSSQNQEKIKPSSQNQEWKQSYKLIMQERNAIIED